MPKLQKKYNSDQVLILVAVLLLILISGAVFWLSFTNKQNNRNISQVKLPKIIGKASLIIDFGNGKKRAFEGDIIENEMLIDVLNQAVRAGRFSYKLDGKNNLASIDKLRGDGEKSWHWYLNSKKINKQPSKTIVKPDDKILIKYE